MYRDLLSHFPLINLVLAGEVIFFVVFFGSFFWVFRKGSDAFYDKLAAMPLEKEEPGHE